jgi:hypothetical protein
MELRTRQSSKTAAILLVVSFSGRAAIGEKRMAVEVDNVVLADERNGDNWGS